MQVTIKITEPPICEFLKKTADDISHLRGKCLKALLHGEVGNFERIYQQNIWEKIACPK